MSSIPHSGHVRINTAKTTTHSGDSLSTGIGHYWTYGYSDPAWIKIIPDSPVGTGSRNEAVDLTSEVIDKDAMQVRIKQTGTNKVLFEWSGMLYLGNVDNTTNNTIWILKRADGGGAATAPHWWAYTKDNSNWLTIDKNGFPNVKGRGEYAILGGMLSSCFV